MIVKELKAIISQLPDDMPVVVKLGDEEHGFAGVALAQGAYSIDIDPNAKYRLKVWGEEAWREEPFVQPYPGHNCFALYPW